MARKPQRGRRKPHTKSRKPQTKSRQRSPVSAASRRKSSPKSLDLQERAFLAFAQQHHPLWNGLIDQCRQFAEGFNKARGAEELQVQAAPTILRVAYARADAELLVQLDKVERYVQAWLNTDCASHGGCLAHQPSIGLTVNGNELQFVLAGDVVSDERLAVALLTQLTSGKFDRQQL